MVKYFKKTDGDRDVIDFDKVRFSMDVAKLITLIGCVIIGCKMYFSFMARYDNHIEYDWNTFHQERYAKLLREQNEYKLKVPNVFEVKAAVDQEHKRN